MNVSMSDTLNQQQKWLIGINCLLIGIFQSGNINSTTVIIDIPASDVRSRFKYVNVMTNNGFVIAEIKIYTCRRSVIRRSLIY